MDPRILKTKRDVRAALIDILKEIPYEKVTIKLISERAMVARPTFYAHFTSVQDILIDYLSDLYELALGDDNRKKDLSVETLVHYFSWIRTIREVVDLLYKNNLEAILYKLNRKYINERNFLHPQKLSTISKKDTAYLRYIQLAGGILYAQVLSLCEQNWEIDDKVVAETVFKSCSFIFEEILRNREFLV